LFSLVFDLISFNYQLLRTIKSIMLIFHYLDSYLVYLVYTFKDGFLPWPKGDVNKYFVLKKKRTLLKFVKQLT